MPDVGGQMLDDKWQRADWFQEIVLFLLLLLVLGIGIL
jgi:hypothetical protein